MKKCTKCNIEKDYKYFHKNKKTKDKHHYHCKACRKEESLKQYNMTLTDYELMFNQQRGQCKICKTKVPRGQSTTNRFYVDHCHITGRVRGLLCHDCNTGLGLFKDKPERLLAAINYLRELDNENS